MYSGMGETCTVYAFGGRRPIPVSKLPATHGQFGLCTCTHRPLGPYICPGFQTVNCSWHRYPPAPTHVARCGSSTRGLHASRFPANPVPQPVLQLGHCTPPPLGESSPGGAPVWGNCLSSAASGIAVLLVTASRGPAAHRWAADLSSLS